MSRVVDELGRQIPRARWESHFPTVVIPITDSAGFLAVPDNSYGAAYDFAILRSSGPVRFEVWDTVDPLFDPASVPVAIAAPFSADDYANEWVASLQSVRLLIAAQVGPEQAERILDWYVLPVGNRFYPTSLAMMIGSSVFSSETPWFETTNLATQGDPTHTLLGARPGRVRDVGILGPRRIVTRGARAPVEGPIEWV